VNADYGTGLVFLQTQQLIMFKMQLHYNKAHMAQVSKAHRQNNMAVSYMIKLSTRHGD